MNLYFFRVIFVANSFLKAAALSHRNGQEAKNVLINFSPLVEAISEHRTHDIYATTMRLGSTWQYQRVVFDTLSGKSSVFQKACDSCYANRFNPFNPENSTTFEEINPQIGLKNLIG